MDRATILLALTSSLWRARMRSTLHQEPSLIVVGEAADVRQAVLLISSRAPQFVLCDHELLTQPGAVALMQQAAPGRKLRLVLVTAGSERAPLPGALPVVGTLPLLLSPHTMARCLRDLLGEPPVAPAVHRPGPSPELQQRFRFTGPLEGREEPGSGAGIAPAQGAAPTRPLAAMRLPLEVADPSPPQREAAPLTTVSAPPAMASPESPEPFRQSVTTERRRRSQGARLTELAQALQRLQQTGGRHQRDAITGLPGPAVLEEALSLLVMARQTTTLVLFEARRRDSAYVEGAQVDAAPLRRIAATLRANIRRGDLACQIGPCTFVVLMPGLDPHGEAEPVERVRTALTLGSRASIGAASSVGIVVGVHRWEPGQSPAAVLEHGLRVLRATGMLPALREG